MPESNRPALVAQIEAMIESGNLGEARRLIEGGEDLHGPMAELVELRRRLAVVESTVGDRGQIDSAIRRAREEMNRADYPSALGILEQVLKIAPTDPALREMLQQTTRAALRHEGAVERNRAVAASVDRISAFLSRGKLEEALVELREANHTFGKHKSLLALQERLDGLWKEAELERTVAVVDQARAFLDAEKWTAAEQQAERVLRADPKNEEALAVKQHARGEIEREQVQRHAALEIDEARQDVERLIRANEVVRATQALQDATGRLGRHDVFEQLAERLDQAKTEIQATKRLEWTQRRLKEAEDLVRQASRLLLQGQYEEAMRRLDQARELHPDHPEVEDMLQAARTAQERSQTDRRRLEALQAAKIEIRQHLEALRLTEAATRLQVARSRFSDADADFEALATRLRRLRETEQARTDLATPQDVQSEAEALERQRALATAYSWKQALLFAFRGEGSRAFWGLVLLALSFEALAALINLPILWQVLRGWVSLVALSWLLEIVRETLRGHGTLPSWENLALLKPRGLDLAVTLAVALLALAPVVVFLLTREWHGLLGDASAVGWWLVTLFLWSASAIFVLACGAAGAFGFRWLLHFQRHPRGFRASGFEILWVVHMVFILALVVVLLRLILVPYIPWIGAPLATVVEVYILLTVAHLIGVVIRRHHIELTRVYR